MPVKQDGSLHAATLKARQVPDDGLVDAPGAPTARYIGTAPDLRGWDTPCRILQVTDASTGREVNDQVDVGTISIILEPYRLEQELTDDQRVSAVAEYYDQGQVRVDFYDGYFTDIVGPVPPGVPISEHTPGADFADQHTGDTQPHLRDLPQAAQPFEPGQSALAALAGAGQHGEPLSDDEKAKRAIKAELARAQAAALSRLGAGGALEPQPQPPGPPDSDEAAQRDREASFTRAFAAEIEQTPDDLAGAIARAEQATGFTLVPATTEEPPREDV